MQQNQNGTNIYTIMFVPF